MTWTYTGDPANVPLDAVRLAIGDTDTNFQLMQDGEITYYLTLRGDDIYLAASDCCYVIAAGFAKTVDYKIGPEQVKASDRYEHYMALYRQYAKRVSAVIATPLGAPSASDDGLHPIFEIGMDDNREGGVYRGSTTIGSYD